MAGVPQLYVDPATAEFPAAGGLSRHVMHNTLRQERMAVKVRCSDNALYRVRPVFAIIEPGVPVPFEVARSAGPPKEDRLVMQYAIVPPGQVDPAAPFGAGTFAEFRLPLIGQPSMQRRVHFAESQYVMDRMHMQLTPDAKLALQSALRSVSSLSRRQLQAEYECAINEQRPAN